MQYKISYLDALRLIMTHVPHLAPSTSVFSKAVNHVLAEEVTAGVDCPSVDSSLKDGYAVFSEDVAQAGKENPVCLSLVDVQSAGDLPGRVLSRGTAIRVTTGAALPYGAQAVIASEFTWEEAGKIYCIADAEPGRNILPKGVDVHINEVIARSGEVLHPALIGLMAAAGMDRVKIFPRARVCVLGTGSEVVAPGHPLTPGKLYASNMVETVSWLKAFGLGDIQSQVVPDKAETIRQAIENACDEVDAFISSGGAWTSEKDLMIGLLEEMGWEGVFHRVKLGPGKACGFGLLRGRPFFLLPGGPPSHEAAFLLLALPGILAMDGRRGPAFPRLRCRLQETLADQAEWTQVKHARVTIHDDGPRALPIKSTSRLSSMARKNALILMPEGVSRMDAGDQVEAIMLHDQYQAS